MGKRLVVLGLFCFVILWSVSAYAQETAALTIRSRYGSTDPAVGRHTYPLGTVITASVATPVYGPPGVRYVYTDYRARGSPYTLPPEGTENTVTFTIIMNTIITWRWKTQYLVTTSVSPPGSGTVEVWPLSADGFHDAKSYVTFYAIPNEGWIFSHWTGGLKGTQNPQGMLLRGPREVIANFVREKRLFTVDGGAPDASPPDGTYEYDYGSTVNANCGTTPWAGGAGIQYVYIWHFGTGDVTEGPETSILFVITTDSSVMWLWQTQYRLTTAANPPDGGTVTPSGETWHYEGSIVTVTATSNTGYSFTNWSGDLSGTESPKSLTMNRPKNVTANFTNGVPAPVADFTGAATSGYAPLTVQFTDTSTGSITSWEWDFDNNGTVDSTEQNPICIYSGGGTFTVRLTVSGSGGSDEEVKIDYITVLTSSTSFVKTWGSSSDDLLYAVAVDSSGNIYCAGYTRSFGAGSYDALLLKYDSSGTLQWAKTWGESGSDYLYSVAVDSLGNIYCAGYTWSFGAGNGDTLLLKYNSSGALEWAKTWGGSSSDHLWAVAADSLGNIYCAGSTFSYGAGSIDALLLKYDSSGALQWAKTWGGSYGDYLYAVAVDSSGDIYCAGETWSFGAGYYSRTLLLKYNSSGTPQWAKTWGEGSADLLRAVAVDSTGDIYCAGYTDHFGTGYDALLLKYDSSGGLQWAKTWGGSGADYLYAVAVDSSGDIYFAGYTSSFGAGNRDALLLKYDSLGTLAWAKTWGGTDYEWLRAVAVDSAGNIYLSGNTYSYAGFWQEVTSGTEQTPTGTEGSPTGSTGSPPGTQTSPTGTETSPTGSETGAGQSDTLLLKNW